MAPIKKIKKFVHENPAPFIAAAATAGLVVGVAATVKLTGNGPSTSEVLNKWLEEMNAAGFAVYAFDPTEKARWAASLQK